MSQKSEFRVDHLLTVIVAVLLISVTFPAFAVDAHWDGSESSSWADADNWSNSTTDSNIYIQVNTPNTPAISTTDTVLAMYIAPWTIASPGSSLAVNSGADLDVDTVLYVGSGGLGSVTMAGGTVDVGTNLIVGNAGVGSVTQSGGTVNVTEVFELGNQTTAAGSSYNISGGALNIADDYHTRSIGSRGAASMNVSGSAVVTIGGVYYSTTGFEIGGHLSGGNPLAESTGTSTLTQTGGTVNVTSGLPFMRLGIGTGVTGIYDLQGGTLNLATDVENWAAGTGYIKVNGGTLNFTGDSIDVDNFEIGTANGATGQFTLSDSIQSLTAQNLTIGSGTGNGTLNIPQGGGTVNVDSTLKVGNTGTGSITMNGGTVNVGGTGLDIGSAASSVGGITISDGTINVDTTMTVGNAGVGNVTQSGGAVNVSGAFFLGNWGTAAGSSYNISGGELNVLDSYYPCVVGARGAASMNVSGSAVVTIGGLSYASTGFDIGGHLSGGQPLAESTGTSVLTQTGGIVNLTGGLPCVRMGIGANATGIYDLQGGTLNLATDVENLNGTSYMKINGGTLNFTGDSIDVDNFEIGTANGSYGQFTLAGSGRSLSAQNLTIGSGTGIGTLNIPQSGGTVNVDATLKVGNTGVGRMAMNGGTVNVDGSGLEVGSSASSVGGITISGGTINVDTAMKVGEAGFGSVTQSGGTVNVSEAFFLADWGTAVGSYYDISGGALNILDSYWPCVIGARGAASMNVSGSAVVTIGGLSYASTGFDIGGHLSGGTPLAESTGTSVLTQTGGTVNLTSGLPSVRMGIGTGVTGIYDLQGGTLNLATDVENLNGTSYIKVNGGTLNFTGDSIDVDNFEIGTAGGATGQFTLAESQSLSAQYLTIGSGTGTGTLDILGGASQFGDLVFGSATSKLRLGDYQTINVLQSNYSFADALDDITNGYVAPCTAGSAISVDTVDIGGTNYTQLSSVPWSMGEPMIFWWGAPGETAANFQIAEDGNYNTFFIYDTTTVPTADIAAMASYGQRPILRSATLLGYDAGALDDPVKLAQLNTLIDTYKECSNAYAYHLGDEPSAADFPYIARMMTYVRARDPDHLPYVNLLAPSCADTEQLGCADYATYLQQYVDTVHPTVLSYDYYGLTETGDAPHHLHNLGVIANAAKDAGIPFINVVQNCKHDTCSWLRKPTASEMRFLTTSTLAYGASGIAYFAWSTSEVDGEGNALGGVYDVGNEETTDVYDWVTPLNEEFKNVAAQYQGLEWLGTYLRGYSTLPPGTTQLAMTGVPFNVNLSNTETYTSGDPLEGLLFGFFDTDGTEMGDATFVYIANLDYSTGVSYTLTGPGGDLSVFDATNNVWTDMESSQITLNLVAGGGVFVGLTSMVPYIPSPVPEPPLAIGLLCLAFAMLAAIRRRRV